jgi:hypothetical protein
MEHLSEWHAFNRGDRSTYPKVNAQMQVRFETGYIEEGTAFEFFPRTGPLPVPSILAWRYIKDKGVV